MKSTIVSTGIWLGLSFLPVNAQTIKDPLFDYYKSIKSAESTDDPHIGFTNQTRIYVFKADIAGNGDKAIFITDDQSKGGPHGDYSWSVYLPLSSDGYRIISDGIDAGIKGPEYIGYIDQIKRYGIIKGGKYGVSASYVDGDTIKSQPIDLEREHANPEHYPKYFHDKPIDHHIVTYTLAQLANKYATP